MEKFNRKCPMCDELLSYTLKSNRDAAERKTKLCLTCSSKERYKKYGSYIDEINKEVSDGKRLNGFSGKTHTKDSIEKIKNRDKSSYKTKEFRDKISSLNKGENNPMWNKSVYSVWNEKYGKEMADIKFIDYKRKMSISNSGSNNPMYNKKTPNGSGNGWSGWYNGWFFRSILELSYMINIIERFNLKWESGEKKQYIIHYIGYNGQNRTYRPDFIISNKFMVEIKPKRLHRTKENILKKEAGVIFCDQKKLTYKITFCSRITDNEFKTLVENKKIKLTKRYKIKYDERFNKKRK